MKIEDGKGTGKLAEVNSENRLLVESISVSEQHNISKEDQESYQVEGEIDIATSEKTILVLTNTSNTKDAVVSFIRIMSIGAAAASASSYFNVKLGGGYSSGGTTVSPVNVYIDSPKDADVTAYEGSGTDIVMSGTPIQIDRNYTANSMQSYNKEGSIVIPKNSSVSITHLGSTIAGKAYARISFFMD